MSVFHVWNGIGAKQFTEAVEASLHNPELQSLRLECLQPVDIALVRERIISVITQAGHQWATLFIYWRPDAIFEEFVEQILRLGVFRDVNIKCPPGHSLPPTFYPLLLQSCTIKLTLSNITFSSEQAREMGQAMKELYAQDTCKLRTLELVATTFQEQAFTHVAEALKENKTLLLVKVWYSSLSMDSQVRLLDSLTGHPTLTCLDWIEKFSERTAVVAQEEPLEPLCEAFDQFLSSPDCKVARLGLSRGELQVVGQMFQRLTANKSVRWLDLSYNGTNSHDDSQLVFENLYRFQDLHYLDLSSTRLEKNAFDKMISHPVARLRHICCWDNLWEGTTQEHATAVMDILQSHPSFLEFFGGLIWRDPKLQFHFDARKVYQDHRSPDDHAGQDFPVELWPRVLGRANNVVTSDKRRARAIYHLVQGAAFQAMLK